MSNSSYLINVAEGTVDCKEMLAGKQPVYIDFALGIDIHAAFHHGGNGETESEAGTIPRRILLGSVDFVRHVSGIVCVQDGRFIATVPGLAFDHPYDPVVRAIGRNRGV